MCNTKTNEIEALVKEFFDQTGPDDLISHLNTMSHQMLEPCTYTPQFITNAVCTNGQLSELMVKLFMITQAA